MKHKKHHLESSSLFEDFLDRDNLLIKKPQLKDLLDNGLVSKELRNSGELSKSFMLFHLRMDYVKKFGFTLLSEPLLDTFELYFKNDSIIEVGAGSGWLSHQLQQRYIHITPVDNNINTNPYEFHKKYTDIIEDSAEKYINKNSYDTILMSWPDYSSPFAFNILKKMPKGKTLIYVGEREGGCTADDKFFHLLDIKCRLNEEKTEKLQEFSLRWAGIHDDWYVYTTISN